MDRRLESLSKGSFQVRGLRRVGDFSVVSQRKGACFGKDPQIKGCFRKQITWVACCLGTLTCIQYTQN